MVGLEAIEGREPLQFGKYRLHRLLARGGMGEVYLARLVGELGFEKELVVKTILPEYAAKARFIELFAAEAKTAVALSHGNIVPIYELGRAGDTFYIVMGYVDGPSVADLLEAWRRRDERPPSIAIALHIVRGVLTGLAYAHRNEPGRPAVVHRDISPRNVLIDRSGQVRIVDFGIAAPAHAHVDLRAGSTGYMAPEQARGEAADPRADVFSTACLAYVLLTGARAFPTEGVWATPDLARVPEDLREPLAAALSFDPGVRPADAAEFLRSLRPAIAKYTATFGDHELAVHLAELFPRGWDLETEPAAAGHTKLGEGKNQTFATRLTAITNVPVRSSMSASERWLVGDESQVDASVPAQRLPSRWQRSALTTTLGAVAIGAFAFGLGRFVADTTPPPVLARFGPVLLASLRPPEVGSLPPPSTMHAIPTTPAKASEGEDETTSSVAAPVASTRKRDDEAVKASGFLQVVAPSVAWAEVKIDGRALGHTPTRALKLSPGRHRVEVRCIPDACPTPTPMLHKTVTIVPGETLTVEAR